MSNSVIRHDREDYDTVVEMMFSETGPMPEKPDVYGRNLHDLTNPRNQQEPQALSDAATHPDETHSGMETSLEDMESAQDGLETASDDSREDQDPQETSISQEVTQADVPLPLPEEVPDFRDLVQTAYDLGFREATEQQQARIDPLVERLKDGIDKLNLFSRHLVDRARSETVDIAVALAEHLLQDHIMANPSVLLRQARGEIEQLRGREEIVIRLHPELYESFEGLVKSINQETPGLATILLQRDPKLEAAGCVIDTDMEQIDLTWSSRLQQLLNGGETEETP